jgi:hypothetical protein
MFFFPTLCLTVWMAFILFPPLPIIVITRLSHPNEVGIDITSRTCICARSACWAAGAVADYGDVKRKGKKGETARGLWRHQRTIAPDCVDWPRPTAIIGPLEVQ